MLAQGSHKQSWHHLPIWLRELFYEKFNVLRDSITRIHATRETRTLGKERIPLVFCGQTSMSSGQDC